MSEAITLSEESVARIAEAIVARLRAEPVANTVDRVTVGIGGLKTMLCCGSRSALYREIERLGLRSYRPGKYRIADVQHAVAMRAQAARKAHKQERQAA